MKPSACAFVIWNWKMVLNPDTSTALVANALPASPVPPSVILRSGPAIAADPLREIDGSPAANPDE